MHASKLTALLVLALFAAALTLAGCAGQQGPSKEAYEGGGAGAAVGAAAGALLDDDNRWRGGVIGGALGAVLGGTLGQISHRAAQDAAKQNQPVHYQNQSGNRRVVAEPSGSQGNCQTIKEKYYEKGQLVKETERQVCN